MQKVVHNLKHFAALPVLLLCACQHLAGDAAGDVLYENKVQVAIYDTAPRSPTASVAIITRQEAAIRPHRVIAELTVQGDARDEGLLVNALTSRARKLGAEALIRQPDASPFGDYGQWTLGGRDRLQRVFRAQAIAYTQALDPRHPPYTTTQPIEP
jgi:hypothetical protein